MGILKNVFAKAKKGPTIVVCTPLKKKSAQEDATGQKNVFTDNYTGKKMFVLEKFSSPSFQNI